MKKYDVVYFNNFKKLKKVVKQGKDLDKLNNIVNKLSFNETIDEKYKDHKLI